jgi:hydrogenase maturation protein HypF
VQGVDLVRAVTDDVTTGVPVPTVAARFHHGLAAAVVAGCELAREVSGTATVALSGGVWQNMLLLTTVVDALERAGFRVLTHSRVPTNDGGISLGQAAVAAARPG